VLPARAISTKNKHLLVIYSIPARGFTAAVSVFRGTPPPKPLICKSVPNHSGARIRSRWADPTGGEPRLSCAIFSFAKADIIETSLCYSSQIVHLSFLQLFLSFMENKKPCLLRGKQGLKNSMILLLPAYLRVIQIRFKDLPFIRTG
jgi:hypothetical protein